MTAASPETAAAPPPSQSVSAPRPAASYALAGIVAGVACLVFLGIIFVIAVARAGGLFFGYGRISDLLLLVATVVAVAGLAAAAVIAAAAAHARRTAGVTAQAVADRAGATTLPKDGATTHRLGMVAAAVVLGAGSVLFFFVFNSLGLGYGVVAKLVLIGAGAVALAGIAGAVVVCILAFLPHRSTSLRTRTFGVIVLAVLIPSLCLAALGVWAYYRSWETATNLGVDQANYRAGELAQEIRSVQSQRERYTPAQRALISGAIAEMYGVQGHQEGAQLATLAQVRRTRTLPAWAIASLEKVGYAVGSEKGPTPVGRAEIIAWRVGPRIVRYYVPIWPYASSSPPVPVDRLFWIAVAGLALIVVIGLVAAWALSRSVIRPVGRLAEASRRIAVAGATAEPVRPEGPKELRELADSFNDMNVKLAKAQETEQAFLLSVSHELKTPLTSIRGYAEGVGDGTLEPEDGAEVIGAESARLERLVGDLLESARMRKSAFTVRRETVGLSEVAQDVARRHEATARDAGLTLHVKTDDGHVVVADADRLLQVVSNLVENAIRCTPSPGSVIITTAPGSITVSDSGPGLTSDDLPRAFERFYLYSRYGGDRPVGTGLGLAIVKDLTEAMGGRVTVSSAVGVGTAFTVTLPAAVTAVREAGLPAGGAQAPPPSPAAPVTDPAAAPDTTPPSTPAQAADDDAG